MKSKRLKPRRIVVLGFAAAITAGTILLMLPVSSSGADPVSWVDSLFTSTSAVCVTGLASVDPGDTLSTFGQIVLAILIQIGGLGISVVGVLVYALARGNISLGGHRIARESLNINSGKGVGDIIRMVAYITVFFEVLGATLSYFVFSQSFEPLKAAGVSIFHTIAAFNNAGFDILGGFKNLADYNENYFMCIVTCILIIFGGVGFAVIGEVTTGHRPAKWSLTTKLVLITTGVLIIGGTVMIKIADGSNITWLEAFFHSVSARTAGFSTVNVGMMSSACLLVIMVLMFIGASPGSTGGGIKTTTVAVLFIKFRAIILNRHCEVFNKRVSDNSVAKSFNVLAMAMLVVIIGTFMICMIEPDLTFEQIMFEAVSAFTTTGLSTGITPELSSASKLILVVMMFVGRLGPLTIATVWFSRELSGAARLSEDVSIG